MRVYQDYCGRRLYPNSILVVSFAKEQTIEGKDSIAAALEAGSTRFRPVLMTALAMIIGMIPMALRLGDGGEHLYRPPGLKTKALDNKEKELRR